MTITQTDEPTSQKPLRLWPGVVAVVLQWLLWYVVPIGVTVSGGDSGGDSDRMTTGNHEGEL